MGNKRPLVLADEYRIVIRLRKETREILETLAAQRKVTLSELVRELLDAAKK